MKFWLLTQKSHIGSEKRIFTYLKKVYNWFEEHFKIKAVNPFSWIYFIVQGNCALTNTQTYDSIKIQLCPYFIIVGIGFKVSPTPYRQWTLDVYEQMWIIQEIPTSINLWDDNTFANSNSMVICRFKSTYYQ